MTQPVITTGQEGRSIMSDKDITREDEDVAGHVHLTHGATEDEDVAGHVHLTHGATEDDDVAGHVHLTHGATEDDDVAGHHMT
jgi:hypothetical protein